MIERFLLIACSFAEMMQGLTGVITLGFYRPNWGLQAAKRLARYRSFGKF
jgi:hypothetical protein